MTCPGKPVKHESSDPRGQWVGQWVDLLLSWAPLLSMRCHGQHRTKHTLGGFSGCPHRLCPHYGQSSLLVRTDADFFFKFFLLLFIFGWVFVAARGLLSSCSAGFSLRQLLLLHSAGSRCFGSVVVVHELSCPTVCGIFPD